MIKNIKHIFVVLIYTIALVMYFKLRAVMDTSLDISEEAYSYKGLTMTALTLATIALGTFAGIPFCLFKLLHRDIKWSQMLSQAACFWFVPSIGTIILALSSLFLLKTFRDHLTATVVIVISVPLWLIALLMPVIFYAYGLIKNSLLQKGPAFVLTIVLSSLYYCFTSTWHQILAWNMLKTTP
ncbi:MAG: hypothetical protein HQM16_09250 [Deltaproteobacteria bacterium]|nr:hypothetical protein [Deltaproteobacteria bacterium]